jgi:hypothetical protein
MKPKTKIMKLLLLIIILCGISTTPSHTAKNKTAKICLEQKKTPASFDMVPSGLLFQF